jgi:hypothetical protein
VQAADPPLPPRVPYDPPNESTQLEQITKKLFALLRDFAYIDPDYERHDVTREGVGKTDLASVPRIMWWYVASYGRHTRAALVHDELVDQIERHDADWVFRCALRDSRVGVIRRWLVFTAVSFETTFRTTFKPIDEEKKARLVALRNAKGDNAGTSRLRKKSFDVRKQRDGWYVTVIGFLTVAAHLGAAVWLGWRAADAGSRAWWAAAAVVAASWILTWGEWRALRWAGAGRLVYFLVGMVLVVPVSALLVVPLAITWAAEWIWYGVRALVWGATGWGARPLRPDFEVERNAEGRKPGLKEL